MRPFFLVFTYFFLLHYLFRIGCLDRLQHLRRSRGLLKVLLGVNPHGSFNAFDKLPHPFPGAEKSFPVAGIKIFDLFKRHCPAVGESISEAEHGDGLPRLLRRQPRQSFALPNHIPEKFKNLIFLLAPQRLCKLGLRMRKPLHVSHRCRFRILLVQRLIHTH